MTNRLKTTARISTGIVLWLLAITFFMLAVWLLINDKTSSGATSAGFGTILLCLVNLDRLESFKGFGLEAKTRDLREAISDAESTLVRLEEMSSEVKVLSESINAIHSQLGETNTIARRAAAVAFMGQ